MNIKEQFATINARASQKEKEILENKTKRAQYDTAVKENEKELASILAEANPIKEEILLNAIIHGADFTVRHGSIAPYTIGYYVTYTPTRDTVCTTSRSKWWETLPASLRQYLDNNNWTVDNYIDLLKKTKDIVKALPKQYNRNTYNPSPDYLHSHHIANGYEMDGFYNIVQGRCSGTYSSYTTNIQNELARQLIVLRGYCADISYIDINSSTEFWLLVKRIYKLNNMDYEHIDPDASIRSTEWAKANPTKCMASSPYYTGM